MAYSRIAAFVCAVAGLACAIVAARYWLQASREYPSELPQSMRDAPDLHILNVQVSIGKAGALNAKAAKWTGTAAVFSATSAIIALI